MPFAVPGKPARTACYGAAPWCWSAPCWPGCCWIDHRRVEFAAERRAIEARAAELTARAIAPGSSLACLDAVANAVVETACERSLFATPEAVAAAVAYVDARISLLAPSIALADRDPSYRPSVERLRRAIEADRFGLVAHVLMTRGCNSSDCADLKLLRDPKRILANMKARAFDGHVRVHAAAWHPNGAAVPGRVDRVPGCRHPCRHPLRPPPLPPSAALTQPAPAPSPDATTGAARAAAPATSKFDFPSAASIPAVSIMNPEPSAPPAAEPRAAQTPPKRTPAQPARRQTAREPRAAKFAAVGGRAAGAAADLRGALTNFESG